MLTPNSHFNTIYNTLLNPVLGFIVFKKMTCCLLNLCEILNLIWSWYWTNYKSVEAQQSLEWLSVLSYCMSSSNLLSFEKKLARNGEAAADLCYCSLSCGSSPAGFRALYLLLTLQPELVPPAAGPCVLSSHNLQSSAVSDLATTAAPPQDIIVLTTLQKRCAY